MRHLILCLAVLLTATAHAQVYRCTHAGKTTYSDQPCSGAGQQIARQKSAAELEQERAQAYDAELRKLQRRMAEQDNSFAVESAPQPVPGYAGTDWQARKDRDNARTSAGSITNNGSRRDNTRPRRRAALPDEPEPASPEITRCSGQYCYDSAGQNYHSIGNGQIRSLDGTTCFLSGGRYVCR